MSRMRLLGIWIFLLIFVVPVATSAQDQDYNRPVPLMDYVPQEIGIYDTVYEELSEVDCRSCHGNSLADRHHATETVIDHGLCTPCHEVIPESPGVVVIRDCVTSGCHSTFDLSTNGWHHDTDLSASGNCIACHDPNLIARISPVRDFLTYPPSVVTPSPFSCENCHWGQRASITHNPEAPGHPSTYDHYDMNGSFIGAHEYSKPIYENIDTHHMGFRGNITDSCTICHSSDPDDSSWSPNNPELIRYCEVCHDVASLHTIAPHVQGGPGWMSAGFHVDSDFHLDANPVLYRTSEPTGPYAPEITPGFAPDEMCMGCHGDTITANAPGPLEVPFIQIIEPAYGVCGAIVTLRGVNFGQGGYNYHIQFKMPNGNWMDLPIYSWTSTQIEFQVPCWEVAPRNYKVRVETPGGESNQLNFTVQNVAVSALSPGIGACGIELTVEGVGFGNSQSQMLDYYFGVHHVVDFVASQGAFTAVEYGDWSDNSFSVKFSTFFEDGLDQVTQERNFIRDDDIEPLITRCSLMGTGLWSVRLKTVYFGDDDGSLSLSSGDTIFQIVPSNPKYFELIYPPVINILNHDGIDNSSLIKIFGHNFGPSQTDGEVRIGSESQAQNAAPGKGLLLGDVLAWSNTLIEIYVNVPEWAEGGTWFVWVEKGRCLLNSLELSIR